MLDDLTEYLNDGGADLPNDLLNRAGEAGNEIANSITQNVAEQVADGLMELGGVGSGKGSHQRVIRDLLGVTPNRENIGGLYNAVAGISDQLGIPNSGGISGMISDIKSHFDIDKTMNEYHGNMRGIFEEVGMFNNDDGILNDGVGSDEDLNGDGVVDKLDTAISKNGEELADLMKLLNPLQARANRDPTFYRTIKRKPVRVESKHGRHSQKDLVQQGYANYVEDVNEFSVRFN